MAGPLAGSGVVEVPAAWRRPAWPGAAEAAPAIDWEASAAGRLPFFAYHSLVDLFPEVPGLAPLFNGDASFRRCLREAAREDMATEEVPDPARPPPVDDCVQAFLGTFVAQGRLILLPFPRLTQLFSDHGIGLTGRAFMARLLGLCNGVASGSWTDIVGAPRRMQFWHQDEGHDTYTVMLGFPPSSGFAGEGVFSQAARISHRLTPIGLGIPIEVDWEIPEERIFRPIYCAGQEVIVYNDSMLLHKAPDAPNREAVWRFL